MKNTKKNSKQILFEMMHKVGGMPLNESMGTNHYVKEILLKNINRITNATYNHYNNPRTDITIDQLNIPNDFITDETRDLLNYVLKKIKDGTYSFLMALQKTFYNDKDSIPGFVGNQLNSDKEYEIKEHLKTIIKGIILYEIDGPRIPTKEEIESTKELFKVMIEKPIEQMDLETLKRAIPDEDFFIGIQKRILTDLLDN